MARLVRKNLMVDGEALQQLAQGRGTSESQAVRDAVSFALAAHEMVSALQELHELGAFADYEQRSGAPGPGRVAEHQGIGGERLDDAS